MPVKNQLQVHAPVTKVAERQQHRRPFQAFRSARDGMRAFLDAIAFEPGQRVLLPAYIGWSAREGSGVFDPVRTLALRFGFYRMDAQLHIDLQDLERQLRAGDVRVVVLIHYFGYPDPAFREAAALARRHGAVVLEDEAHAMLSDLVGGVCGRTGDACIYSLHKLLPVPDGGLLVHNETSPAVDSVRGADGTVPSPLEFDLLAIARARVANGRALLAALARRSGELAGEIVPLWPELPEGVVPQTLPVLVRSVSRDELYFRMNAAGYGVVSLYHTMISELDEATYPDSFHLARHLTNLPVHQDATPEQLEQLVDELVSQVAQLRAGTA